MSTEFKKQLTDIGTWAFKGSLMLLGTFAVVIFNDMNARVEDLHGEVKEFRKEMKNVTGVVIRLEEKVDRSKEDIRRLEETKQNK